VSRVSGGSIGLGVGRDRWARRIRIRCTPGLFFACAIFSAVHLAAAAEPVPTVAQSGPGRFEVAAIDASVGHAVTATAEEAWRMLAAPLGLPEAFSSPVFVRVVTDADALPAPFHVTVEPGGVVSLRLRALGVPPAILRRALVQALLLRVAVAQHGVTPKLTVPLWLEHGCVELWQTRADAAQLDALKQESLPLPPPALSALLDWPRGGNESRLWIVGSAWLVTILQSESGRAREWPAFLSRLLNGEPAEAALAATFGEKFSNVDERELWWQTAWHQAVHARVLPVLAAADSRAQLQALARFVFAGPNEEADLVVPLGDVLARGAEPIVAAELQRRAAELARFVPALHPFYRNAGLSLAAAFSARGNSEAMRTGLAVAFESDWRDAAELEAASTAALDGLERKAR
jgi:hypothetical protein